MARVEFAAALQRHYRCPVQQVESSTLAAALEAAFLAAPALRDYVLDDQGAVRKHVAVFVNGELVHERRDLSRALGADDSIYVAQALSGG